MYTIRAYVADVNGISDPAYADPLVLACMRECG